VVKVRSASVDDLEQLLDCERSVWESLRGILPDDFLEEELRVYKSAKVKERKRRYLESPDSIALVAEEKGRVIGFAEVNVGAGVSHLGIIGVRKEHRKRGIGSALLEEHIVRSRQKGAHKVYLWTQKI